MKFPLRMDGNETLWRVTDADGQATPLSGNRANQAALIEKANAAPQLAKALREIATADHPDAPVARGPVSEHEFAERLMRVARAALAAAGVTP